MESLLTSPEIMIAVILELGIKDVLNFGVTCKEIRNLTTDRFVWANLASKEFAVKREDFIRLLSHNPDPIKLYKLFQARKGIMRDNAKTCAHIMSTSGRKCSKWPVLGSIYCTVHRVLREKRR